MYVYEPSDDSYLLSSELSKRRCARFLDMGCGTGIQANSIARAKEIVCADINKNAVDFAMKNVGHPNAKFIVSDLFSNINGRYDLIAFNTPYLDDEEPQDIAWTYMQNGADVIRRFLCDAKQFLSPNGKILMVLSDRGYDEYKAHAESLGYSWKLLRTERMFFEQLHLVQLERR